MSEQDRRKFLKDVLAQIAKTTGSVVLASSVLSNESAQANESDQTRQESNPDERAERLAQQSSTTLEVDPGDAGIFRRGAFRRGAIGGGFRNGGFRRLGGGFVNGGFRRF